MAPSRRRNVDQVDNLYNDVNSNEETLILLENVSILTIISIVFKD